MCCRLLCCEPCIECCAECADCFKCGPCSRCCASCCDTCACGDCRRCCSDLCSGGPCKRCCSCKDCCSCCIPSAFVCCAPVHALAANQLIAHSTAAADRLRGKQRLCLLLPSTWPLLLLLLSGQQASHRESTHQSGAHRINAFPLLLWLGLLTGTASAGGSRRGNDSRCTRMRDRRALMRSCVKGTHEKRRTHEKW